MREDSTPFGLCRCGCGNPLIRQNDSGTLHGHHWRVRTPDQYFWPNVRKSDGCWEWTASRHTFGYGLMMRDRKHVFAHRHSWELHVGPIPDGMQVCHRCDNPACVRPEHLFIGGSGDNMRDKITKGRANMRAIPPETVRAIRTRRANGERGSALAREYDVSEAFVSEIHHGKYRSDL